MKTAISLPNALFEAAEELAHRLGISRSELYARALSEYVAEQSDEEITARLDAIYAEASPGLDDVLMQLQGLSLPQETW